MKTNQSISIFGVLLYILAVITGLLLIVVSTWADMEAASYGFPRRASAALSGLACPILMTRSETGTISLRVSNPTEKPLHPAVRTEISADFNPQVFIESVDLAPGEAKSVEWSVGQQNIDLGMFIFANVQVYATYPIPNREKTCGIFIIDLPGSGGVILTALLAFSLIGLGGGLYLMSKSGLAGSRSTLTWNAIIFLAALIVGGLILSYVGSWIPSIGILVLSVLISILLVNSMIFRES
jgi:hypothetical protein